jgi:tetratricopeptide (TPR) repeat protein
MAGAYCTKCGSPISTGVQNCPRCGVQIPRRMAAPSASSSNGTQASWARLALLGAGVVFAALAGAYAYLYVGRTALDWKISRLLSSHDYVEAKSLLHDKLNADPNDSNLWLLLGQCDLRTGDLVGAQEAFGHAFALDSTTARQIGATYFQRGDDLFSSDAHAAQRMFEMAAKYDPALARKIGQKFFEKGQAAFQLRSIDSAEKMFDQAIGFDQSLKANVADQFARAATSDLEFSDLAGAERYAKEAAAYDPEAARKQAQKMFANLSAGLCNLHAPGKQKFMSMMKLCNDLGLADATRESIPYRFAYAMELYENGPKRQGIDILRDIARDSPKTCEGVEANYVLSPPPPGRITVSSKNPVSVANGAIAARLLYVDVLRDSIKLTFSLRASEDQAVNILYVDPTYPKLSKTNYGDKIIYLLDDNGTVLKSITGYSGGQDAASPWWGATGGLRQIKLRAGEEVEVSAVFPMVSSGAEGFKFVAPGDVGTNNNWEWPEVEIKKDLFD